MDSHPRPPGDCERYATNMNHSLIAIVLVATVSCASETTGEADERAEPNQMETTRQIECREYLKLGPPAHMDNCAPESLTEILIAHGR